MTNEKSMKEEVPPGIVAFMQDDGKLNQQNPNAIYREWVYANIAEESAIHTISVDGKEWSVGDSFWFGGPVHKIESFKYYDGHWFANGSFNVAGISSLPHRNWETMARKLASHLAKLLDVCPRQDRTLASRADGNNVLYEFEKFKQSLPSTPPQEAREAGEKTLTIDQLRPLFQEARRSDIKTQFEYYTAGYYLARSLHAEQQSTRAVTGEEKDLEFKHLAGITAMGQMTDNPALHGCVEWVLQEYFKLHPECISEDLRPLWMEQIATLKASSKQLYEALKDVIDNINRFSALAAYEKFLFTI